MIEHFTDPRPVIHSHWKLLKPGGTALITVPNYGGLYGRLQKWLDPENLALHNLDIMSVDALRALVDGERVENVKAYLFGHLSPWILNIQQRLPTLSAHAIKHVLNVAGLLQPCQIDYICPKIVLEFNKRSLSSNIPQKL